MTRLTCKRGFRGSVPFQANESRRGNSLVEFSVVASLLVIVFLFVAEVGRMVLVASAVANAARAGMRYAEVHGSTRTVGVTSDNASGPADDPGQVLTVIRNFAASGALSTNRLIMHVTYPAASNAPGKTVNVTVVYPYDPLTIYFPRTLRLGSAAQGVIVY
jgi:Flp pilus assembly protein TadG